MREIRFRGRDIETGEWRYGFYYVESAPLVAMGKKKEDKHWIVFPGFADWNMPRMQQSQVCPGSIGEFTGRKDKNGKEVFEGDIFKDKYCQIKVVEWYHEECRFCFRMYPLNKDPWPNPHYTLTTEPFNTKWQGEVIGNLYETPELVK